MKRIYQCIMVFVLTCFMCACATKVEEGIESGKEPREDDVFFAANIELQDNVNQMFYGTWRYEEVVSQHSGLGGDTGYEELLGQTVVYEADYYECGGESIQNPKYEVAIYPISELGTFFVRQNGFAELFPATPYFVYIRITDKPSTVGGHGYHAVDFILQDENTLYCYDMNCIYKLVRVEYSQKYSEGEAPSYSEHW